MGPHNTVYWAQSDLTLKTAQPLTSLTVELRIAQTGGVQNTGNWRTLPSDDFTVTVQETGGALVYRWVLKPGPHRAGRAARVRRPVQPRHGRAQRHGRQSTASTRTSRAAPSRSREDLLRHDEEPTGSGPRINELGGQVGGRCAHERFRNLK